MLSWRKLICNKLTKFFKVVTGDTGKHMMLNVIFHVPIKKRTERIKDHAAATDAEVRMVGFTGGVLMGTADKAMKFR